MTTDSGDASNKDTFDEILRRVVTGDSTPELAAGSLIANRFLIECMIGAGGMGAVYVARDQTLGRDVAIKLHHTRGGAARLRREAMAMARLAHPNVVTVFEVGELGPFPFVVMEYVPGTTLRAWLADAPRTVDEILAMLVAAGEGLAAAHGAGLIHRDIKPENVLVGSDGRARVGDFGLARELDSQENEQPVDTSASLASMTATGSVMGTPAYMAPEQISGIAMDARADQFAFCVTVWEALWGSRPFAGSKLGELMVAINSGKRQVPPPLPAVPARVRIALERGLAADPDDRFASMQALLAELRTPKQRRRTLLVVASTLGAVALAVAGYSTSARSSQVPCADIAATEVAGLPLELAARLHGVGAVDDAQRVRDAVNHYARNVGGVAQSVCVAERRGDWSAELAAKSRACQQVAVRTTRDMLRPAVVTAADATRLVSRASLGTPPIGPCGSATYLAASPKLPDDPAQLDQVIDARAAIQLAMIELQSRNGVAAQPHLDRAARSTVAESPLVKPSLLVARALGASNHGDVAIAEKLAADGYYAGRAVDDDGPIATALAVLLALAEEKPTDDPMVATWLRTAAADAERMAARTPWVSGQLYVAIAHLASRTGDGVAATKYAKRAQALSPDDQNVLAHSWLVEGKVVLSAGKIADGRALYERAIQSLGTQLGPEHPIVASALADYASVLLEVEQTEEAMKSAQRAMAIIEKAADQTDEYVDDARLNLGAVLLAAGQDAEAQALLETARAHYVVHRGRESASVALIDMNLAIIFLDRKEPKRAVPMLEEALAIDEKLLGHDRAEIADVLYNLAVAKRAAEDLVGARAAAQRCADINAKMRPGALRHAFALNLVAAIANQAGDPQGALTAAAAALALPSQPQAVSWAQLERGRALIALGRRAEALPLLAASRAAYETQALPERVAEIDRLLGKTR